jgi:hypothetical protein
MCGYTSEYMCFVEGPPLQYLERRDVCVFRVICRYGQQLLRVCEDTKQTPRGDGGGMRKRRDEWCRIAFSTKNRVMVADCRFCMSFMSSSSITAPTTNKTVNPDLQREK